jgi:hypothetical protein
MPGMAERRQTNSTEPREPAREPEHRVLPFRRPGALFKAPVPPPPPVSDLTEYERTPDEPDDYRHRMIMNALAFVATVVLVVVGIWIADVMAHMRKNQDCVLTGRPGCTPVNVPPRQR